MYAVAALPVIAVLTLVPLIVIAPADTVVLTVALPTKNNPVPVVPLLILNDVAFAAVLIVAFPNLN